MVDFLLSLLPNIYHMKKILTIITIITAAALSSYAQPRAMGVRFGTTGLEADYQHDMKKNQFVEGNLGLDFGTLSDGTPGLKATAIYNFIWAHPAWTDRGTWALYAGPGASIGYVHDEVHFKVGKEVVSYNDGGFMLGVCGQVGLEYTFWFPLQLSVDLRPCVGMHINGHEPRVGIYDTGFMGFLPSLSVRYRF